ncbi:MAG TPA: hypothetical protein VLB46_04930 [Pyrinomonadaceae bacterium]|nr:hypothetical protein [Pyrinomonadaceae bacterium]
MKRLVGLVLAVIGGALFVIFTSSLNAAQTDGAPIGVGALTIDFIIVVLDFVFLGVAIGGMKLAGLRRRTVGLIALATGAAILIIGVRHHIEGPSLDKIGPVSDDRIPVSPELNIVVYAVAGLCLAAGLLLTILGRQAATKKHKPM